MFEPVEDYIKRLQPPNKFLNFGFFIEPEKVSTK
jgi:hypothetical protein